MERFRTSDGLELAYHEVGAPDGPTVVLLHGFAASTKANFDQPGITAALVEAGYRTVGLDARGHGHSDRPHEPAGYPKLSMVRDVSMLLDHLDLESVAVVGYSMGSLTTAALLPVEPRARLGVLGGVGHRMLRGRPTAQLDAIADALEADDLSSVGDPTARAFRAFAEGVGADRLALAATQRAGLHADPIDVGAISVPVLVITGEADALVGDPHRLAEAIPDARARAVTGDHLSAVNDPAFSEAIVAFLDQHPDG